MTTKLLTVLIAVSWILPAIGISLCSIENERPYGKTGFGNVGLKTFRYSIQILLVIFRFVCSVFILLIAAYTDIVRKKHVKHLNLRMNTFQPYKIELTTLQKFKQSVKDTFRLNCCTVVFMMSGMILGIIKMFCQTPDIFIAGYFLAIFHQFSNPFVYAFTHAVLRKEVHIMARLFRRNRVGINTNFIIHVNEIVR